MKNYKEFNKKPIGMSDIASLILAGCKEGEGFVTMPLCFGTDGSYSAYIVDGEAEIGSHYKLVAEFNSWLKIYDDDGLTARLDGSKILVYCAGEQGCIIQIF